jgi:hypothetical protein
MQFELRHIHRYRKSPLPLPTPWENTTAWKMRISKMMQLHQKINEQSCLTNSRQSDKGGRRSPISSCIQTFFFILYGLLKMTTGINVPDPSPELIEAQNFDFAKPKLFFKNISHYVATLTYIHVQIPFNFTTVLNTKTKISKVYDQLLTQHEEPFKAITKLVTDVSLNTLESSLEDFRGIIKALPQKLEILTPGRPKRFIAIGISIAAMAMLTFNTVRITPN